MLSMNYKTVNSAKAMRDTSNLNKWVFKRVQYAKSATSWEMSLIIENKQPQLKIKQGTRPNSRRSQALWNYNSTRGHGQLCSSHKVK